MVVGGVDYEVAMSCRCWYSGRRSFLLSASKTGFVDFRSFNPRALVVAGIIKIGGMAASES